MKLKEYMNKYGITITWLAEKAKLHRGTIINAIYGKPLNMKTAKKIEKATEGMVTLSDLISE